MDAATLLHDLTAQAAREGITVHETRIVGAWGLWDYDKRAIFLDRDLTVRQKASTLAHELVHARWGHRGCQPDAIERRVDEEAARLLITPERYAQAEYLTGSSEPGALAVELDVSIWVVEAWQRAYERTLIA